eukprot:GABV01003890.1.p1 GENE.GABV01003890.1~~GABV01003890.1.p1  ORF type:complete len:137 (-),score=34.84 GABV01003890.1:2-412(-)
MNFMESCVFKGGLSFVGGGVLGGAMGLVLSSFGNPYSPEFLAGEVKMTTKEQFRAVWKDMLGRMKFHARQFAIIGGVFATVECGVERYRAKRDAMSSVTAGCITGAGLSARAGPSAAAFGCVGFAAFSLVIDSFYE